MTTVNRKFLTDNSFADMLPATNAWMLQPGSTNQARVMDYDFDLNLGVGKLAGTGGFFAFRVVEGTTRYVQAREQWESRVERFHLDTVVAGGAIWADLGERLDGTWKVETAALPEGHTLF